MLSDSDKDMMKSLAPSKFDGSGGPLAAFAHWMSVATFIRARNQSAPVMVVEKWILIFSTTFVGSAQIWWVRKSLLNGTVLSSGVAFLSAFHEQFIGLDFVRLLNNKLLGQDLTWVPSGSSPSHLMDFLEGFLDVVVQHSLCWVHMPQKLIPPSASTLHAVLVRVFNGYSKDLMTILQDNMRREFTNIMTMYDQFRVPRDSITLETFLIDPEWLFVFAHTHLRRLVLERPWPFRSPVIPTSNGGHASTGSTTNSYPRVGAQRGRGIQVFGKGKLRPFYSAVVDTPSFNAANTGSALEEEDLNAVAVLTLDSCVLSLMNDMKSDQVPQECVASFIDMFTEDDDTREHVLAIITSHSPFGVIFTSFDYLDVEDPGDPSASVCQICSLKTTDGNTYEILCWNCNKAGHFASQCPLGAPLNGILKHKPKHMSQGKGLGRWRDQPFGKAGPPPTR